MSYTKEYAELVEENEEQRVKIKKLLAACYEAVSYLEKVQELNGSDSVDSECTKASLEIVRNAIHYADHEYTQCALCENTALITIEGISLCTECFDNRGGRGG